MAKNIGLRIRLAKICVDTLEAIVRGCKLEDIDTAICHVINNNYEEVIEHPELVNEIASAFVATIATELLESSVKHVFLDPNTYTKLVRISESIHCSSADTVNMLMYTIINKAVKDAYGDS